MTITDFQTRLSDGQFALLESLPSQVADRMDLEMLRHRPTAAALHALSAIRDPRVWRHVGPARIDWDAPVALTARLDAPTQVLIRVAQSFAEGDLRDAAEYLGDSEYAALIAAAHIACPAPNSDIDFYSEGTPREH